MGPGMQDKDMASHSLGARKLQGKKIHCQLKGFRLYRVGQIDDIGSMYDKLPDAVLAHESPAGFDIQLCCLFAPGILRGSGVNHKGIGFVGNGFLYRI